MSASRDYLQSSPSRLDDSSRISVSSPYPLENYAQKSQSLFHDRIDASPSRSVVSASEHSVGDNFGLPPSGSHSRNLNDEILATKKLEKDNFDMKMKIFYLEEQLQRYQGDGMDTRAVNANELNELSADNMTLRVRLEETTLELDQRNKLLIKVAC